VTCPTCEKLKAANATLRDENEVLKSFDSLKRYKTLRAVHQAEMRRFRRVEKEWEKDKQRLAEERKMGEIYKQEYFERLEELYLRAQAAEEVLTDILWEEYGIAEVGKAAYEIDAKERISQRVEDLKQSKEGAK
jgi:hypothetical protein